MRIGIPGETAHGTARVALVPGVVKALSGQDHDVLVQKRTGACALISDEQFLDDGVIAAGCITRGSQFVHEGADAAVPGGRWSH